MTSNSSRGAVASDWGANAPRSASSSDTSAGAAGCAAASSAAMQADRRHGSAVQTLEAISTAIRVLHKSHPRRNGTGRAGTLVFAGHAHELAVKYKPGSPTAVFTGCGPRWIGRSLQSPRRVARPHLQRALPLTEGPARSSIKLRCRGLSEVRCLAVRVSLDRGRARASRGRPAAQLKRAVSTLSLTSPDLTRLGARWRVARSLRDLQLCSSSPDQGCLGRSSQVWHRCTET
jgi:hypothetical protein